MKKPGPNHKETYMVEGPGCKNLKGQGLSAKAVGRLGLTSINLTLGEI
jgi:hypothetical protein